MKTIDVGTLCCLLVLVPLVASQLEAGSQQASKQWFWNSTTTATDSQTADEPSPKNTTSTTPTTISIDETSTKKNETEDTQIFSPGLFDASGFFPANITSGRSALAELFSDDFVPANVTRGRSSKAMNLDLIGNIREGRILNDDPGNRRLSLQGFIPIVSFSGKDDDEGKALSKSPKRVQDDDLYYNNGPYPPIPLDDEEQTKSENYYNPVTTTTESHKNHRQSYQKAISPNSKQEAYGTRIQDAKHHNYYIPPPQNPTSSNQQNKEKYAVAPAKEVVRYITADDYHKRPTYQDATQKQYSKNQQDQYLSQQDAVSSYLKNLQDQYLPKDTVNTYPKNQQDKYHGQDSVSSYLKNHQDQYKPLDAVSSHPKSQQDQYHTQDAVKAESQAEGHFIVSSKPNKDEDVQYAAAGPYPPEPLPNNERFPTQDTTAKQFRPGSKQFDQEGLYELSNGNYILSGQGEEDKCICVPFYLCRNGYLTNYGRSLEKDDIDERSARKISKRSAGNKTEARDASAVEAETLAPYTEDIMARMIGLNNVGDSCGLLRRCCRVPRRGGGAPGGLLPFSPDNYPIPQHPGLVDQLPPGLNLPPGFNLQQFQQQGNGEEPNAYIVNSQDQYLVQQPQSGHHAQGQQIILVPQEVPQQPQRRPRPIYPQPKPPQSQFPPHPPPKRPINPNRSIRPVYPQRQRPQQVHPQEPVYQPQPSYPQPQPVYPPPGLRPPKPLYPGQPDFTDPSPHPHQGGQCGARNGFGIHGRVNNLQYHDDASEFGEYPWQAAILLKVGPGNNLFVCGGTLISNQWVATAAHCLKKHHADELKVRLGDWDVHRDDEFYPYVEKFVVEVVAHPDFYPGNLQNDLALLRLESPIDPSLPHISPACLPDLNERFDNLRCWVTGWGKNAFGEQGEYQSVLKEVDIPMLSHRDCEHRLKQTRLGRSYQLHPGFLCAGGEPGKDACTGDGGSPLVCDHGGTWKVAGLVSWGIGCGQPGVPGIYVNMAKYRSWIDTVIHRYG